MIITAQKPIDEILEMLLGKDKVFLVGCNVCASVCKTGGQPEIDAVEKQLAEKGKLITGKAVLDPACNVLEVKRFFRKHEKEIKEAGIIISYACGGGTQALAEQLKGVDVCPGNNTLFQGDITKATISEKRFDQKCSQCGECMLALTGGICPVTRCPKGLMNGPCGGIKNGKCEVDKDLDCAWLLIYERLKSLGRLDEMKKIRRPKDNRRSKKPQNVITK